MDGREVKGKERLRVVRNSQARTSKAPRQLARVRWPPPGGARCVVILGILPCYHIRLENDHAAFFVTLVLPSLGLLVAGPLHAPPICFT